MALRWWWLGLLALVLVGTLVRRWWRSRPTPETGADEVPVAHTELLLHSPTYAALVRTETRLRLLRLAAMGLVVIGAVTLMSRWASVNTVASQANSRDIMLCLDASSSMTEADVGVVAVYGQLAERLRGDRMGLMIWSGASVPVFPLTDDYAFVSDQLQQAAQSLVSRDYDFLAGTVLSMRRASSQIGDGLVSCLQRFDQQDRERTRVIVLASDNDIQGPPVFTLTQAAERAQRAGVIVHCIAADTTSPSDLAAFRAACAATGGSLVQLSDGGSADAEAIANQISGLASNESPAAPQSVVVDAPWLGLGLAAAGLAGLGALWILQRRRVG